MPPTPQTVQLTGQKQSQQQYDPSKGPPVQNAASLHTPPPQLPGRVQASNIPISSLPTALHLAQQQQQLTDGQIQPQIQVQVKAQAAGVPIQSSPQNQLPAQISQTLQTTFHAQMPIMATTQPQGTAHQQVQKNLLQLSILLAPKVTQTKTYFTSFEKSGEGLESWSDFFGLLLFFEGDSHQIVCVHQNREEQ